MYTCWSLIILPSRGHGTVGGIANGWRATDQDGKPREEGSEEQSRAEGRTLVFISVGERRGLPDGDGSVQANGEVGDGMGWRGRELFAEKVRRRPADMRGGWEERAEIPIWGWRLTSREEGGERGGGGGDRRGWRGRPCLSLARRESRPVARPGRHLKNETPGALDPARCPRSCLDGSHPTLIRRARW